MTRRRLVGAVHAVAVEQTRARFREIDVPDLVVALQQRDALELAGGAIGMEQAELYGRRVLAEHGEVDAGAVPRGAERVGCSRAGPGLLTHHAHGGLASRIAQVGRSHTAASGGSVRRIECGRPCQGTGSLDTPPILPRLLPP